MLEPGTDAWSAMVYNKVKPSWIMDTEWYKRKTINSCKSFKQKMKRLSKPYSTIIVKTQQNMVLKLQVTNALK